jgi:hypothetical protein
MEKINKRKLQEKVLNNNLKTEIENISNFADVKRVLKKMLKE